MGHGGVYPAQRCIIVIHTGVQSLRTRLDPSEHDGFVVDFV
jgi:hypothetical protein